MGEKKDFLGKVKDFGKKVVKGVEKGLDSAKTGVENTILDENLKHRFNLENPFRFVISKEVKANPLETLMPRHAKRYDEDDIFVFLADVSVHAGEHITDLADKVVYQVIDVTTVKIPVTHDSKIYELDGKAARCKPL